jgi:type I restriction enzyme S subunit
MISDVVEHSLDSLCLQVVDCPHATPEWTTEGFIVLRNQNIKGGRLDLAAPSYTDEAHYLGRIRRAAPQKDDIVITREAPMGEVCQIPADLKCCLGQRQVLLRPNLDKIDSRFLLYALQSPHLQHQIGWNEGTGSTVSNLRIPVLKALKVPTPPIETQREISSTLGSIDDRIALLRETNATLEAIAQALFKSWFVDFDPVRAKADGADPQGMDAATAALFPDSFEETELGSIPFGWQVSTIAALGDVICGKTPATSKPENYGDDVPFITIPDMHGQLVVTSTNRSLSRLGAESQKKKYLLPGSICVSCIATPGLVVRVTSPAQTNQQINSVVPFDKWGKSFPLFLLRRIGDAVRAGGSGGSVFHNLSKSGFEALKILLTNEALAKKFDELVEPLLAKIVDNQEQVQVLTQLRDSLLPRLISGQLRLSGTEVQVDAVCG